MAISLKHQFTSPKADGLDSTLVQPSNWNAEHTITMAANALLGRATAGTGAVEEISLGTNLEFSAGSLNLKSSVSVTALAADSLTLDSVAITATGDEINHLSGVTSAIQTQIDTLSTSIGALGALAALDEITASEIEAATLVTAADGIASNDNDTSWPTTAAVIDYVASQVGGAPAGGVVDLGDLVTTSGSSVTMTSLDLSGFKELHLWVDGVGLGAMTATDIYLTIAGKRFTPDLVSGSNTARGLVVIDLDDGNFVSNIGVDQTWALGTASSQYVGLSGITTATTSITISRASTTGAPGNFDAGVVRFYGVS